MRWVRIDNRLVHGQIIETWLPFTRARMIVVVNDELSTDVIRQEIMSLAIPDDVEIVFLPIPRAALFFSQNKLDDEDVLVLFSSCLDARQAYEAGFSYSVINIGNLHYAPGKRRICQHVAINDEDESCLDFLEKHGVALDYRCIPSDPVHPR